MRAVPSILHLDMDAFFAAVEQRHKPSLRGKPVVVGGVGLRGVVSTASYEARAYGIGSAMPTAVARRRCPNAAYLFPRFGAYHEVSQVVMGLLRELSPLVEPQSLDEAFVDLDAMPGGGPETVEDVRRLARRIGEQVAERTGLTASVGAGTSKLIAKVASDADKPVGCVVVPAGAEQQWLDPLPVRKLWGVGPATADRLSRLGATTVEQLRSLSGNELVGLLGNAWGGQLHRLARGVDEREVSSERETKSVSVEDTYPHDLMDRPAIRAALTELAERVVRAAAGERAHRAHRHRQGARPRLHHRHPLRDHGRAHRRPAVRSRQRGAWWTARPRRPPGTCTGSACWAWGSPAGLAEYAQGDLIAELEGMAEEAENAEQAEQAEKAAGGAGGEELGQADIDAGAGTAVDAPPGGRAPQTAAGDGAGRQGGPPRCCR